MSDEDGDFSDGSEGFSASEDDWKPDNSKITESSDDASDFEEVPVVNTRGGSRGSKNQTKGVVKNAIAKKKKPNGQSLRSRLFNKYRPPPKTVSNSPSASTSKSISKNSHKPNDDRDDDNDYSSDSSVDNYLVDPKQLDVNSAFFDISSSKDQSAEQVPFFDCNVGLKNVSDSEDGKDDDHGKDDNHITASAPTAFDFKTLLDNANKFAKATEEMVKHCPESKSHDTENDNIQNMDVLSLLALGENMNKKPLDPLKQTKTKSSKSKKQTRTGPTKTLKADVSDSEEEEFEEVAGYDAELLEKAYKTNKDQSSHAGNLEIVVDLPTRQKSKKTKAQEDIENALRRRLNHEIKRKQLLMHKTSFLCLFARNYNYNSILNSPTLMQKVLKLLPSKNAYPPDKGTEVKYFQSFVTWFKTALKVTNNVQYPLKKVPKKKKGLIKDLSEQITKKEAKCWQDLIFIFVILVRGMGLQCRLVANLQTVSLKPNQSELLSIKMKKEDDTEKDSKDSQSGKSKSKNNTSSNKTESNNPSKSSSKKELNSSQEKQESKSKKPVKRQKKMESNNDDSSDEDFIDPEGDSFENLPKNERPKRASRNTNASTSASSSLAVEQDMPKEEQKLEEERPKRATRITRTLRAKSSNKNTPMEENVNNPEPIENLSTNSTSKKKPETENPTKAKKEAQQSAAKESSSKAASKVSHEEPSKDSTNNASIDSPKLNSENEEHIVSKAFARPTRGRAKQKLEQFSSAKAKKEEKKEKPNFSKLKRSHSLHSTDGESENKKKPTKPNLSVLLPDKSLMEQTDFKGFSDCSFLEGFSDNDPKNSTMIQDGSPSTKLVPPKTHSKVEKSSEKENTSIGKILPTIVVEKEPEKQESVQNDEKLKTDRCLRSRSKSPKFKLDPTFLKKSSKKKILSEQEVEAKNENIFKADRCLRSRSVSPKVQVEIEKKEIKSVRASKRNQAPSVIPEDKENLKEQKSNETDLKKATRSRSRKNLATTSKTVTVPQLDGADDVSIEKAKSKSSKKPTVKKLNKSRSKETENSEDEFEPSPAKRPKAAPVLPKHVEKVRKDRRVLSTDNEDDTKAKKKDVLDFWVEVWCDVEMQWVPVELMKGKVNSIESIRKTTSSSLDYVFAFQNDLSVKDVTARYCPHWSTTIRKNRMDKDWLNEIIKPYLGHRTERDIREDHELRRIHEEKPLPTSIAEFKDHPLYVLERHLLKFQALYPAEIPPVGFIRNEAIYPRDCVHTLHSREIWLKSARVVKLGEQPYKVVKARPKWDRMTQSVIKDQPLEIFGYWQTMDYDPPTAENGIVPRNAYGNVELFKACMLPKKTVHLRLAGLSRICKKLNIDCANAVVGFDFHQGACHPTYDGFVVCEEFADTVTAAWNEDQVAQERKEQEKYEARVYGNWKKLIRGLLIRERLKKKYNF